MSVTLKTAVLIGLAVLALGLGSYAVWGDHLSMAARMVSAYRAARTFQARYPHFERDVAFDPGMEPRLDVYWPTTGDEHPVLVFVHGGSWKDYDKDLFAPVAMKLVPEGMVVVIPDYTHYPDAGYEQMAAEVAAALNWTLESIQDYGGDPSRVVVAGHSAGGHLASLALLDERFLAVHGRSATELCGLVGMSGVYDVQAEYDYYARQGVMPQLIAEVMGGGDNLAAASPVRYVRPDLPPVLLIHGTEDETVPPSIAREFHTALKQAGAESRLDLMAGVGHSDYLLDALGRERAPLVAGLIAFVDQCAGAGGP
jgi:acetyl esterase/lipase